MLKIIKALIVICSILHFDLTMGQTKSCVEPKNAPLCPNSGSTLLDETYPVQSFVISTEGYRTNKGNSSTSNYRENNIQLPASFVSSIILGYSENFPEILVPTQIGEDFDLLKNEVTKKLLSSGFPQTQIDLSISKIKRVDDAAYTWQQDYFESFVDLETGRPNLRAMSSYDKHSAASSTKSLGDALSCGTTGKPLTNLKMGVGGFGELNKAKDTYIKDKFNGGRSWGSGEMGGNIEGLPGGLCLKGNNQANDFVSQYCGSAENFVEVDVGWLEVGHVDELVKVVPTRPKVAPEECNFSVMVASPDAGLEALKNPEFANRPFIELGTKDAALIKARIDEIVNSKANKVLCNAFKDVDSAPKKNDNSIKSKAIKAFYNILSINSFTAYAGGNVLSTSGCAKKLAEVTNRQMFDLLMNDPDFVETNKLVQIKMNKAKADMAAKLKQRLPQCTNIKFIDAPDIFHNTYFAEIDGVKQLPEPGRAGSIFPNPTNSVLANETMIVSETPNKAFNDIVKGQLKNSGLKTAFVDTWNYAHSGDGNMHCSSHSIPYCQPRGKK